MSTVATTFRGGLGPVVPIEGVQDVSWFWRMDDVGEATVVTSDDCCLTRQDISPLSHELHIFSDSGDLEWQGPIVRIEVEDGRVTLEARTLDWWLNRVVSDTTPLGSPGPVYQDAVDVLKRRGLNVESEWIRRGDDTGVLMDLEGRKQTMELLTDMADRGFHWATFGRSIYFGEQLNHAPAGVFARIFDTSQFADAPVWTISGLGYASAVEVVTENEDGTTTSRFAGTEANSYYGAATLLQYEGSPHDWLRGRNEPRWSLNTFDSGVVSPFELTDLWPGLPVLVRGKRACEDVDQPMIIKSLYREQEIYGLELVSTTPDYDDI